MKPVTPLRWMCAPTRRAACAALTAGMWLLLDAASASAAIPNPLGGVAPDFGLFGDAMNSTWKRIVAFIWALILVGCVVRVIVGAFKVRRAKSRGYTNDLAEGSEELQDALIALGLVALASPLIGTVLFVVGG
ncbi:hypothetical protein [Nocardia terpenica]|uniref:DUF4235 domain-containing protein n=1 Tax=Nocardia terpenica TaxID=455432 RepID=A0A291RRB8_9NOCA|nr:hypothetical protein [Nocardia terpenica]ATL69885.1 hypothetical protein CRH09_30640 [Nocardia terpenica]